MLPLNELCRWMPRITTAVRQRLYLRVAKLAGYVRWGNTGEPFTQRISKWNSGLWPLTDSHAASRQTDRPLPAFPEFLHKR